MYEQFQMISKNSLTPIRDYNNDFFHANDSKLPNLTRVKDGYGGARASYSDSIGGDLDTMDNKIDDRVKKSSNSSVLTDMKNINLREMLKKFIFSEEKYIEMTEKALTSYRFNMQNKKMRSKKIFDPNSKEDVILFGNLETICAVSYLYLNSLSKIVTKLELNPSSIDVIYDELVELHVTLFNRMKQPYTSYIIAYQNQTHLVKILENSTSKIVASWYHRSYDDARQIKLSEILQCPYKHVHDWLENIKILKEWLVVGTSVEEFQKLIETFTDYISHLNIDNEDNVRSSQHRHPISSIQISKSSDLNPESSGPSDDGNFVAYIPSVASSVYTEVIKPRMSPKISLDEKPCNADSNHALMLLVRLFKEKLYHLTQLRKLLVKHDITNLADNFIMQIHSWTSLLSIEKDSVFQNIHEQLNNKINLCVKLYKEKKEELGAFKFLKLESFIIKKLETVLALMKTVKGYINDLKVLHKDYLIFKKEKQMKLQDIKRTLLGTHYEQIQNKLVEQLPRFLTYINQFIVLFLLSFNAYLRDALDILISVQADLLHTEEGVNEIEKDYDKRRNVMKKTVNSHYEKSNNNIVLRRLF
ncbi:uncharacterized protein HLK63_M04851 [Nakaseomyces glabratus]|nr:uncharacterized protein GW608_M04851 [Nakaseomyces glabratus]UCS28788.1 uncharacterized protein HLK63_M04851 [Nakaseomyces glabratus]UCS34017.1 uncharacterized protein HLK64_M04851 [Nakaseomyces glabratus]UCS39247.1 uncharacterized protein HLK62_M04851 [Nakaseomyces glabratus]